MTKYQIEQERARFEKLFNKPGYIFWNGDEYESRWPDLSLKDIFYNERFKGWLVAKQDTRNQSLEIASQQNHHIPY